MLPMFNEAQLNKLSDIASEIAVVALAAIVLPAIFERPDFATMTTGFVVTLFFWLLSLWVLKNK